MYGQAIECGGWPVITGGASGVGLAAAERFAQAGLNVVLADLPGNALDLAKAKIESVLSDDCKVLAVPTGVSDVAEVAALGDVAVLMNNAGIMIPSSSWEQPQAWRKLLEVNLFCVIYGVQAFLPRMIAAKRPAVVINTGSKQGITTPSGNPAYNVSKAGVKVLTEMLAHDLRLAGAPMSVHLFVPGFTYTGMIARHIPKKPSAAWTSEQTVDHLIDRMSAGDFYILCPDNDVSADRDRRRVAWSMGDMLENRPALSRWDPNYAAAFAKFKNTE